MNSNYEIYHDNPSSEDIARLDGYLRAKEESFEELYNSHFRNEYIEEIANEKDNLHRENDDR